LKIAENSFVLNPRISPGNEIKKLATD